MSTNRNDTSGRDQDVAEARRRAGLAAAAAGLGLVPWFLIIDPIAGVRPESPEPVAPAEDFVAIYVDNASRIPMNATLFTGGRSRLSTWAPKASVCGRSWGST